MKSISTEDAYSLGFFAGMLDSKDGYVVVKAYCKDRNLDFKNVLKLMRESDKIIEEVSLRYGIVHR